VDGGCLLGGNRKQQHEVNENLGIKSPDQDGNAIGLNFLQVLHSTELNHGQGIRKDKENVMLLAVSIRIRVEVWEEEDDDESGNWAEDRADCHAEGEGNSKEKLIAIKDNGGFEHLSYRRWRWNNIQDRWKHHREEQRDYRFEQGDEDPD
jgi:hypothetical protein